MVGSLGRHSSGRQFPVLGTLHLVAGVAGAEASVLFTVAIADSVGLRPGHSPATAIAIALLSVGLLADMGLSPYGIPSTGVQVPARWRVSWPRPLWTVCYGFLLGATVLTRMSSSTVLVALPAVALAFGASVPSLVFAASYGAVRSGIVFVSRPGDDWRDGLVPHPAYGGCCLVAAISVVLVGVT